MDCCLCSIYESREHGQLCVRIKRRFILLMCIPLITTEQIDNTIPVEAFPNNMFSFILDFEWEEHWRFTIMFFLNSLQNILHSLDKITVYPYNNSHINNTIKQIYIEYLLVEIYLFFLDLRFLTYGTHTISTVSDPQKLLRWYALEI